MGLFSKQRDCQYSAIVDIGSGSVLVAIIESDPYQDTPRIIWSKRDYTILRQIDSLGRSEKNVIAVLANAMMELSSAGMKTLWAEVRQKRLSTIQVTIVAPWSYTVTKTVSYKSEKEFTLTKEFIDELLGIAHQKVEEEVKENETIHKFGLELVARMTAGLVVNGYNIRLTGKQNTNEVKLYELSAVAHERVVEAVTELGDKLFTRSDLKLYSFMLVFYSVMKDLQPDADEFCLVDITYEATEIGIVRNGILQYCSHIPYGAFSLAREFSEILKIPLEEAFGLLSEGSLVSVLNRYSDKQNREVIELLEAYQTKLADLFKETGDKLSIPKPVFLHGNVKNAVFFSDQVRKATTKATGLSHLVQNITCDLLGRFAENAQTKGEIEIQDTAMLLSAYFFHTHNRI